MVHRHFEVLKTVHGGASCNSYVLARIFEDVRKRLRLRIGQKCKISSKVISLRETRSRWRATIVRVVADSPSI